MVRKIRKIYITVYNHNSEVFIYTRMSFKRRYGWYRPSRRFVSA